MREDVAPTHFRACCKNVIQVLEKVGVGVPELDARLLISDALSLQGAAYFLEPDRLLSEQELSDIASRLARRMAGEPVSRIIGMRSFWKHDFHLSADVLDPRPDSETLIEVALELVGNTKGNGPFRLLDLGTGSGALLISLLLEWPNAIGTGIDINKEALGIAQGNALRLGCSKRITFIEQDWLAGMPLGEQGPFDLIVCNPPYIPSAQIEELAREVSDFDPRLALDGGQDGLDPYRLIIPQLGPFLAPSGLAIFEIGEGQEGAVLELFEEAGLSGVGESNGTYKDLAGINRCLAVTSLEGV